MLNIVSLRHSSIIKGLDVTFAFLKLIISPVKKTPVPFQASHMFRREHSSPYVYVSSHCLCLWLARSLTNWGAKGIQGPGTDKQSHNRGERDVRGLVWVLHLSVKHKRPHSLQLHIALSPLRYHWPRQSLMAFWIWDEAFHLFSDTIKSPWTTCPCHLQLQVGLSPLWNNLSEALTTCRSPPNACPLVAEWLAGNTDPGSATGSNHNREYIQLFAFFSGQMLCFFFSFGIKQQNFLSH